MFENSWNKSKYPNAHMQHAQLPWGFNGSGTDESLVNLCPSIYYGGLDALTGSRLQPHNFKIIINCLPTHQFLRTINDNMNDGSLSVSSDMILMSLDLSFDVNRLSEDEKFLLDDFNYSYNKILQNFINHFYTYNENKSYLIDDLPANLKLDFTSPLLTGNLKGNLFKLIRLINLFKIINNSIDILILGDTDENFSKALLIGYLMDTYKYNLNSCLNLLGNKIALNFNSNYYGDLLILENLKKFYQENNQIKQSSNILYNNKAGKRGRDEEEYTHKRLKS